MWDGERGSFAGASDEQLFARMARRVADPTDARAAYGELYRRHAPHLLGAVRWLIPKDDAARNDLVQQTFQRAFEKADGFVVEGLAPERAERRVRSYLCGVARNLFRESFARDRDGYVQIQQLRREVWAKISEAGPANDDPDGELAAVRAEIDRLTPRERDLLLEYLHWYDPDLEKQRIPAAVQDDICESHEITRTNLRQIISRTLKKLARRLTDGRDGR